MAWFLPFSLLLTTSLGWIAVMQIRRSAGRLSGLGLAVFDGLLFPLLALDGLMVGLPITAWAWMGFDPTDAGNAEAHIKLFFLLTVVVSVGVAAWADFLIARWVWRAVNKPVDGSSASPPVVAPLADIPPAAPGQAAAPGVAPNPSAAPTASDASSRLSRTATAGAAWAGLFVVNCLVGYTPPGWALIGLLRNSIGNALTGLLLVGPLAVLGFAAPLGATALGMVALRQIRQSRGTLYGVGLSVFDVLLFPLIALNAWLFWLGSNVFSEARRTSSAGSGVADAPGWVVVGLGFLALALTGILIRTVWRAANKYVNAPPSPTSPPVAGTWAGVLRSAALRLVLVILVQLALFETLQQVSVHWKESTGELWGMALTVGALAGLVWACWPGFRLKGSLLFWAGGTIVSGALLFALTNLYSWHLRPNLGLHREEDWVAQHPGFQWGLRQRIARNLWRRPAAPPFGPTVERTLAWDREPSASVLDLDTGRQVTRLDFDETDPETLDWARSEKLDLAAVWKKGRMTALGLGLETVSVLHTYRWDTVSPQEVVDFWILDSKQPKDVAPLWLATNRNSLFLFRTREGSQGLLEFLGDAEAGPGVKWRYKFVGHPNAPASEATNRPSRIARTTQALVQQQVESKLSAMKSHLRLTKDQERAVRDLLEKKLGLAGELSASLSEGALTKEQMREADRSIQEIDRRFQKILTPQQRADYEPAQAEERRTQAQLAANVELMELQPVLQITRTQRDQVLPILSQLHERQLATSYDGLKIPLDWEQQLADLKEVLRPVLTADQIRDLGNWLDLQRDVIKAKLNR
jgi:hypothetical protein